jgi:hypothetical protein
VINNRLEYVDVEECCSQCSEILLMSAALVTGTRRGDDEIALPTVLIGRLPAAELTPIGARWAPPSRPGLIQRRSHMILPSGVRLTSNHPKPKEAATASVPTNTALTSGGTSNDRPAISRLRRTGACNMKAA